MKILILHSPFSILHIRLEVTPTLNTDEVTEDCKITPTLNPYSLFPSVPCSNTPTIEHSNTPTIEHSNTPIIQHSNNRTFQHSLQPKNFTIHHPPTWQIFFNVLYLACRDGLTKDGMVAAQQAIDKESSTSRVHFFRYRICFFLFLNH